MTSVTKVTIDGTWHNELGSRLELRSDEEGRLTGTLATRVGTVSDEQPLTGFVDVRPLDATAVLGFVVAWPSTHSVSVWSGQCDLRHDVIDTTWLLTGEASVPEVWRSTLVGHNRFTRGEPSA